MTSGDDRENDEPSPHRPVLLREVVGALGIAPDTVTIDGTFGAGGYTRAVLATPAARVLAIDRDPSAITGGAPEVIAAAGRLTLVEGRFGNLDTLAHEHGFEAVDAVVLDVGVSSMQLDQAARGFSFRYDGPLDMRMGATGPTAADLVNRLDEAPLADLLFQFGEERRSRAISRAMVKARTQRPIAGTRDLVDVVVRVLGPPRGNEIHPATRTFQALRIAVNDELGELARGLAAAERILRPGGRLAVVTFHSLEDRIVKRFMQIAAGKEPAGSRHLPPAVRPPEPSFQIVNQRPVVPSDEEIRANPRARSAKLRVAVRTSAPPLGPTTVALGVPEFDLDV